MRRRAVALLAVLSALPAATAADAPAAPSFAPVFGSHMVLPHATPLTLSGRAAPGERLTLQVDGRSYQPRADAGGEWRQQVQPLRAGGPYELALTDSRGRRTTLGDVLAGEIWLCSGQSNMEFAVAQSGDQPPDAMQGHAAIRLLGIAHQTALQPQDHFSEAPAWQQSTPEAVRRFSALCWFFARQRIAERNLPIGLLHASWGGAAIEAWIGEQSLARLPAHRRAVELLRQYRSDSRAAELAFARDWVQWWQSRTSMGAVWERGVLDGHADWRPAAFADWRTYPDARLADFTGNLWFSTRFALTAEQASRGATFVLGNIDEVDTTWLNGRFVSNTFGYGTRREYPLEPGTLRAGDNQFTVFVTSTYGAGGMTGPAGAVGIRFDDGTFLPLEEWKYRVVPREAGYPPRAPWESVHGVSGMFSGMIAPLEPLTPTGVIWYQGESNVETASGYEPLLSSLVSDWRTFFGRRDLPFIIVQLPNFGRVAEAPEESGWAMVRHVQQQVAARDAQVGLVVTQDLGDDADLHPRGKHAVAVRAAQVARALEGTGGIADGLLPQVIARDAASMTLGFSSPLLPGRDGEAVAQFSLCPASDACVAAPAMWQQGRIRIDLGALPGATRLRYCWSDGGTCALRSVGGLPASSFELPLAGRD